MQRNPETGLPDYDPSLPPEYWHKLADMRRDLGEMKRLGWIWAASCFGAGLFSGYALGAWLGWP